MSGNVKGIPEGHHTLTPHLVIRNAAQAVEFYKKAFGAEVVGLSTSAPDGKLTHGSLKIGDSILMLSDEFPEWGIQSPQALGGSPVTLHIYVEDVDALWNCAVAAGAKVTMPLADQFWGDRYGQLEDPFGHKWSLATRKENLSKEERERRAKAVFADMSKKAGN
ncbi:MAG: VOC family protein [Candidatus Acidiferrales bacterium]